MGQGQKFLTQVGLGQPSLVWVWKISPKNHNFSIIFPLGQKKSLRVGSKSALVKDGLASYLQWAKSKLGSDHREG